MTWEFADDRPRLCTSARASSLIPHPEIHVNKPLMGGNLERLSGVYVVRVLAVTWAGD
jgi:hypothetical protein